MHIPKGRSSPCLDLLLQAEKPHQYYESLPCQVIQVQPSIFVFVKDFHLKIKKTEIKYISHEENTHAKKASIHFALPCTLTSACSVCLPKPQAARCPLLAPSARVAQVHRRKTLLLSDSNNPSNQIPSLFPNPPYTGIKAGLQETPAGVAPEKNAKKRRELLNTSSLTPSLSCTVAVPTEWLKCKCHLLIDTQVGISRR